MSSVEEYAAHPRIERIARLRRTADELAEAIVGYGADQLTRRPGPGAWAAVEVIGHLRDSEEWFVVRCGFILAMDEPRFPRNNPDRWADERQYLRHDAKVAVDSFRRQRAEMLGLFGALATDDWKRGGVHSDSRGRRTVDDFLSVMAWHDDNHLDQLCRALDGRP